MIYECVLCDAHSQSLTGPCRECGVPDTVEGRGTRRHGKSEIERLTDALSSALAERDAAVGEGDTLRRFLDAEKEQCSRLGAVNREVMLLFGVRYPGGILEAAHYITADRDSWRARAIQLAGEQADAIRDDLGWSEADTAERIATWLDSKAQHYNALGRNWLEWHEALDAAATWVRAGAYRTATSGEGK